MRKPGKVLAVFLAFWLNHAVAQENEVQNLELYILIGQSNMAGRGLVDSKFKDEGHSRVFMLNRENKWVLAKHPLHFDKPKAAGVGPGLAFGIKMAKANPAVKIGLVPCAVGGTSIESWQPGGYDAATKTHPYDDALARIELAMKSGSVKGIIWHQGEANSNPKKVDAYLPQLFALIKRFRQVTGDPDLPFIVGELGRFRPAFSNFNGQLNLLPLSDAFTAVASSKGLAHKGDSTHFDGRSAQKLGRRFADQMIKMQRKSN